MQNLTVAGRIFAFIALVSVATTASADHVNWVTDVETGLQQANASGRLVLLKFTADWCGYCKKMERETFTKPAVASLVNQQFVPVLVDADKYQVLVKHLKIKGLPAILVASPDMVILQRISGYQTEDKLLPILNGVLRANQSAKTQSVAVAGSSGFTPPATRPASNNPFKQASAGNVTAANPFKTTQKPTRPAVVDKPAFGGLCLPGVSDTRSLINGMPQFAIKYRGKTLYFSSQEQLQKFKATPGKYWPMRDGACPVTLAETGRIAEGRLEYGAMFRGKLWFTSSPEQMKKFVASPARFVDALQQ